MGHTFAEKLLAHKASLPEVVPGQIVEAQPDVALSHDNTAPISGFEVPGEGLRGITRQTR